MGVTRYDQDAQALVGPIGADVLAAAMGFNGTTFDRLRSAGDSADALAAITLGVRRGLAMGMAYNGASWDRLRSANVFKALSAVVITSETTIWTPAGGKKFRLMGFLLAQGVATGAVTLKDNTAGSTIYIIPPHTVGVVIPPPNLGNGILSAAANNVLTAQGASTETLTGVVFGTEE